MSELHLNRVPPALSPEEWAAAYEPEPMASLGFEAVHSELVTAADHGHWHKAMAYANAALPASDPRKLTHEHVLRLRAEAVVERSTGHEEAAAWKFALADLISAILPPHVR